MTKQQLREALRKIIKEELEENIDSNISNNLTPEDEEIISQITGGTLNEIAIGKALKNLTVAGLLALMSLGGAKAQQTSTSPTPVKYGTKLAYLGDVRREIDQRTQNLANKHFGSIATNVLQNGFKIRGITQDGGIIYQSAEEAYGEVGLVVHKNGNIGYIDTKTGKTMGAADQQNLSDDQIVSFLENNRIRRINVAQSSIKETIRRIIKQELKEALTPEEQQELQKIEDELKYANQSQSAISRSEYERYKELLDKKKLKENMWGPEPEVADPDVDTDTEITPNEDEDDLTFSPSDLPKVNPKAEREMIKKIIDRYNSLTEKKYK